MDIHRAASELPSPAYIVDLAALEANCRVLAGVQDRSGAEILLALKGFAMFATFPLVRRYLGGVCASGLHEAMLGRREFGGQVHVYSPAFTAVEMRKLAPLIDHISFNSLRQWQRFKPLMPSHPHIKAGLRINPEHSEAEVELYNPCAPCSRLGIRAEDLQGRDLDGISGLHFHTLCEQNSDALERTVEAVERRFEALLRDGGIRWLNMGGGHHITRPDYDIDRLCRVIDRVAGEYDLRIFLEPGEAVALQCGYLAATVLDVVHNTMPIAILDVSATTHMPDVLEMPYRAEILGADLPGAKPHTFRLAGPSCLAGDVIGDYSFETPLREGDRVIFADMAHYTMVKNTTFNGVPLPAIATFSSQSDEAPVVVRRFGYQDYCARLS